MANTQLLPEKITRPMQLMAAWFAMLVLIVTVLLATAVKITYPWWAAGYLVIFSSIIVIAVIGCVLLMLTRYRPHLQDGREYAQWLKDKQTYSVGYLPKSQPAKPKERRSKSSEPKEPKSISTKSNMLINVVSAVGAINLVEKFKNSGFNAEIYDDETGPNMFDDISENESIWLGSRINPKDAINAIKTAVDYWPELKYIHLSNDGGDPPDYVHDQIFFGGSTGTAKRYGLRPWQPVELLSLNETMNLETFHAQIRSRYS